MTIEDYRRAFETAKKEFEALGEERRAIDKRLTQLAQTMASLGRLCGYVPTVAWGLTDGCRIVLMSSGRPMTPMDVRDALGACGFDMSKYTNDLAAVHTVLKRLNESGEVRFHCVGFRQARLCVLGAARVPKSSPRRRAKRPSTCSRTPQLRRRRLRGRRNGGSRDGSGDAPPVLRRRSCDGRESAIPGARRSARHRAARAVPAAGARGPCAVKPTSAARRRQTPDADPKHVYHNIVVAIDPARQLFNGAPSLLGLAIEALALESGQRALHIGTGMGYYTALIAHCSANPAWCWAWKWIPNSRRDEPQPRVDARGHTRPAATAAARSRSRSTRFWSTRASRIRSTPGSTRSNPAARLVMRSPRRVRRWGPISKGFMVLATKQDDGQFSLRMVGFVAIYAAIGIRDDAMNTTLGRAMMKGPFMPAKKLRRDAHDPSATCWAHGGLVLLLSLEPSAQRPAPTEW
jgi:protein-L-isoaspartate(D-aspartate) O-methyltransferase